MDSQSDHKPIIKPYVSEDGQWIRYMFGTQIAVYQVPDSGHKRALKFKSSPAGDNVFIGHFPLEDTDVEVWVDNIHGQRDIRYDIRLTDAYRYEYDLRAGDHCQHRSLSLNGHQLHVKSLSVKSCQRLVQRIVDRRAVTPAQAAYDSSRVKFALQIQKPFEVLGARIRLAVEYSARRFRAVDEPPVQCEAFEVDVGLDNTVAQLKDLIERQEGIGAKSVRLFRDQSLMKDPIRLADYRLFHGSRVQLLPRLLGGCPLNEEVLTDMYGPRGILCLGRRVNQHIHHQIDDFKPDDSLVVEPFVIEMRYDPYVYNTRNHDYWRSRGVPGPKPQPFLGNLLEVFRKPLSDIEEQRFR
ncbi:unnamed protein product, partial [Oppiella nova]